MCWVLRVLCALYLVVTLISSQSEVLSGSEHATVVPGGGLGGVYPGKDVLDDDGVQKVVTILQGNIQQWNFIESQLLEPNVNLGMPEIFIPLRHLTTTLEVLGNILFMSDEIDEAKECLERACPLLELLPPSQNEERLASGCFLLLRQVYEKLYNSNNHTMTSSDGSSLDENSDLVSGRLLSISDEYLAGLPNEKVRDMVSDKIGKGDMKKINDHTERNNQKKSKRKRRKEKNDIDDDDGFSDVSDDDELSEIVIESDDSDSSFIDSTHNTITDRNSSKNNKEMEGLQHETVETNAVGAVVEDVDGMDGMDATSTVVSRNSDTVNDDVSPNPNFDIERRFEELRSPFDHLRSDLQGIHSPFDDPEFAARLLNLDEDVLIQAKGNLPIDQSEVSQKSNGEIDRDRDGNELPLDQDRDEANVDTNGNSESIPKEDSKSRKAGKGTSSTPKKKTKTKKKGKGSRERRNGNDNDNHDNGVDVDASIGSPSSSSSSDIQESGLTEKMTEMLWSYVGEDDQGRRAVLQQARQHYAELHIGVEEFDSPEVAFNLALADAYLAVMHKATNDGFLFIKRELRDYWNGRQSGVRPEMINPEALLKGDLFTVFGDLSPGEKSRLLVLTAFDKALNDAPKESKKRQSKQETHTRTHTQNLNTQTRESNTGSNKRSNTKSKKKNNGFLFWKKLFVGAYHYILWAGVIVVPTIGLLVESRAKVLAGKYPNTTDGYKNAALNVIDDEKQKYLSGVDWVGETLESLFESVLHRINGTTPEPNKDTAQTSTGSSSSSSGSKNNKTKGPNYHPNSNKLKKLQDAQGNQSNQSKKSQSQKGTSTSGSGSGKKSDLSAKSQSNTITFSDALFDNSSDSDNGNNSDNSSDSDDSAPEYDSSPHIPQHISINTTQVMGVLTGLTGEGDEGGDNDDEFTVSSKKLLREKRIAETQQIQAQLRKQEMEEKGKEREKIARERAFIAQQQAQAKAAQVALKETAQIKQLQLNQQNGNGSGNGSGKKSSPTNGAGSQKASKASNNANSGGNSSKFKDKSVAPVLTSSDSTKSSQAQAPYPPLQLRPVDSNSQNSQSVKQNQNQNQRNTGLNQSQSQSRPQPSATNSNEKEKEKNKDKEKEKAGIPQFLNGSGGLSIGTSTPNSFSKFSLELGGNNKNQTLGLGGIISMNSMNSAPPPLLSLPTFKSFESEPNTNTNNTHISNYNSNINSRDQGQSQSGGMSHELPGLERVRLQRHESDDALDISNLLNDAGGTGISVSEREDLVDSAFSLVGPSNGNLNLSGNGNGLFEGLGVFGSSLAYGLGLSSDLSLSSNSNSNSNSNVFADSNINNGNNNSNNNGSDWRGYWGEDSSISSATTNANPLNPLGSSTGSRSIATDHADMPPGIPIPELPPGMNININPVHTNTNSNYSNNNNNSNSNSNNGFANDTGYSSIENLFSSGQMTSMDDLLFNDLSADVPEFTPQSGHTGSGVSGVSGIDSANDMGYPSVGSVGVGMSDFDQLDVSTSAMGFDQGMTGVNSTHSTQLHGSVNASETTNNGIHDSHNNHTSVDSQSPQVTLILTCHMNEDSKLRMSDILSIKVVAPVVPSAFEPEQSFEMRLSPVNPSAFALSIQLPKAKGYFDYKYVISNARGSGILSEEKRIHARSIALHVADTNNVIEIDDTLSHQLI